MNALAISLRLNMKQVSVGIVYDYDKILQYVVIDGLSNRFVKMTLYLLNY